MRRRTPLALLGLVALACGGDQPDIGGQAQEGSPAATRGDTVAEDPGLPTDATEFRPTPSASSAAAGIGGRLWISTAATVEEDGFSLIAQLRGLPEGAYSWAIHRGDCSAPDHRVLGLGYGTVAEVEGRGPDVANGGGPLGEMRRTFTPRGDGTAEETIFVPLDEELTRAALEAAPHGVRLHPNVEGADPGAAIACAPIPALPRPGEHDPEGPTPR